MIDITIKRVENLKKRFLNKVIRILFMDDKLSGDRYNGKEGKVFYVDSMGQLHGTWGCLAVIPEIDSFEVIG